MINICLIVPDLNKGGMERVMSELGNYFISVDDVTVRFILLTSNATVFYKISPKIEIHKPSFSFNNRRRLISTLRTLIFTRKTVKRLDPDVILSFGETYNSFVLLSTMFLRAKVFVSDRARPDKRWGGFHEFLRRILYPRAFGIVAQTNYSKEFLSKETNHKNIEVIPNPVRIINTKQIERKNIILNVGRIIESKRIDLLLRIFSKIDNLDWELWIVGNNEVEMQDRLESLAKDLEVISRVKFIGKVEDVERYYSMSKIFAFTSESEGMPNVLLEAFAAGCACISFDCNAGPSDIIEDGINGFLIKLYDTDVYTEKLNRLVNDEDLIKKFSMKALESSSNFYIENIGNKYLNFLSSNNETNN